LVAFALAAARFGLALRQVEFFKVLVNGIGFFIALVRIEVVILIQRVQVFTFVEVVVLIVIFLALAFDGCFLRRALLRSRCQRLVFTVLVHVLFGSGSRGSGGFPAGACSGGRLGAGSACGLFARG